MTNEMEEPETKKMKAAEGTGDEEMTVQFEDENGEGTSWDLGPNLDHGAISTLVALKDMYMQLELEFMP